MVVNLKLKIDKANIWASNDGCRGFHSLNKGVKYDLNSEILEARNLAFGGPDIEADPDMVEGASIFRMATIGGAFYERKYKRQGFEESVIDAWKITHNTLSIYAYEYGFSPVEALENQTLLLHADYLFETDDLKHIEDVLLVVVQPRHYCTDGPVKTWRTTARALQRDYFPRLREVTKEAALADAPLTSGPHCLGCRQIASCPANRNAAAQAVEFSTAPQAETLNPDSLGVELAIVTRAEQLLKSRRAALESRALNMIQNGQPVLNCGVQVNKRRVWAKGQADKLKSLASLYGVKMEKPTELITPRQAEQAGLSKSIVADCVEIKEADPKLKLDSRAYLNQVFNLVSEQ